MITDSVLMLMLVSVYRDLPKADNISRIIVLLFFVPDKTIVDGLLHFKIRFTLEIKFNLYLVNTFFAVICTIYKTHWRCKVFGYA